MAQLQMVNLAYGGGEKTKRVYDDMRDEYYKLEGIDKRREQIEANWKWLKLKKRG